MSDNTTVNPGAGGDVISTDDVTTLNGAGSTGVKVQRVKVGFGDDGSSRDASDNYPLPVKLINGANPANQVQGPTLTKGTQQTTGFSVQDLKDSGRVIVNASTTGAGVAAVAAEALLALDVSRGGAATASATSHAVTSGKRWRVTGIMVSVISTAAAVISGRVFLRFNPSGVVTTASPIVLVVPVPSAPAVSGQGTVVFVPIPDGIEFTGTEQIGLSQVFSVTTGTVHASIVGYEY